MAIVKNRLNGLIMSKEPNAYQNRKNKRLWWLSGGPPLALSITVFWNLSRASQPEFTASTWKKCTFSQTKFVWYSLIDDVLFCFDACLHVARLRTLEKLIDLGSETLPHPAYSSDFAFKDFLASCLLAFYRKVINKLVTRWQNYIDVQCFYFDWFKQCLNTLVQE